MYHHFAEKRDLFRAVYEQVEREAMARITGRVADIADPWALIVEGIRAFLDSCDDPGVVRIGLVTRATPSASSSRRCAAGWRAGSCAGPPSSRWPGCCSGAFAEAAMMLTDTDDRAAARAEVEATLLLLFEGMRA